MFVSQVNTQGAGILHVVRLYLSSFRTGERSDDLRRLVGDGRRAGVIANALDGRDPTTRRAGVELEAAALGALGFDTQEIDLRDHFDNQSSLEAALRPFDLLWLRGGNVFVLRYALRRAGADEALRRVLDEDKAVYAGYSAGPCVLGPTIEVFAATDDPDEVQRTYGDEPISAGLGVLDFVVVPHVESPGHPATAALTAIADDCERSGTPVVRLRDGQVLTVHGDVHVVR